MESPTHPFVIVDEGYDSAFEICVMCGTVRDGVDAVGDYCPTCECYNSYVGFMAAVQSGILVIEK